MTTQNRQQSNAIKKNKKNVIISTHNYDTITTIKLNYMLFNQGFKLPINLHPTISISRT